MKVTKALRRQTYFYRREQRKQSGGARRRQGFGGQAGVGLQKERKRGRGAENVGRKARPTLGLVGFLWVELYARQNRWGCFLQEGTEENRAEGPAVAKALVDKQGVVYKRKRRERS